MTVTYVEVSADMRHAKVHVSVMGDETHQKLTLRGLAKRRRLPAGENRREIEIRYTPKLTFVLDQGVKHSIEVARILQQVLPPEKTPTRTNPRLTPAEDDRNENEPSP